MLVQLALTLQVFGYLDQARSPLDQALSAAHQSNPQTLAAVLAYATQSHADELQRNLEELLALSTDHGFSYYPAAATGARGAWLIAGGKAHEGLTLLTHASAAARATGSVYGAPHGLMIRATAHANLGRTVEATNCLAKAAQIIEKPTSRPVRLSCIGFEATC
jgi:tetratricopeptide (TPR) repeat protein